MPAYPTTHLVTAEELPPLESPGKAIELVRLTPSGLLTPLSAAPGSWTPARIEARVYRVDGSLTIIPADGALDGPPVPMGFACALADILR